MDEARFCEHCGAPLAADTRFCERCGQPVAPTAQSAPLSPKAATPIASPAAPPAAPAATAPRPTNHGLIFALVIVGMLVALGCLAVGVFGFLFLQSKPAAPVAVPVGTSQVNLVPTHLAATDTPPSPTTTVEPSATAAAPPTESNLPQPTPVPPTLAAPPGLYVSALRLEPGPTRGVDIGFYPMFLNTTGGIQTYRVKVYLYRPENMRNSFGETSAGPITIPVGSTEQKVLGAWKLGGGGGCEDFVARVGWLDDQNRITFFDAPTGGTFESRFPVCP